MGELIGVWEMVRDDEAVADVICFADGQTITKWRGRYSSVTVWPEWGAMAAVHTHAFRGEDNGTRFRLRCQVGPWPDVPWVNTSGKPIPVPALED